MTTEYDNPATQSEKRQVLQNDTMYSRQANAIPDEGGRFARVTPSQLNGSTPAPQYPKLPASSPWHHEALPPEEPLGFSVNELPPLEPNMATNPTAVESELEVAPTISVPQVVVEPASSLSSFKDGASALKLFFNLATGNSPSGVPSTLKRRI